MVGRAVLSDTTAATCPNSPIEMGGACPHRPRSSDALSTRGNACTGSAQRSGTRQRTGHALTIQGNLQINPGSQGEGPFHSGPAATGRIRKMEDWDWLSAAGA